MDKKDKKKDLELKKQILEGAIQAFNERGMKFTMDDIAKRLGISKKTIYTIFDDKNDMFVQMVDYIFDAIKDAEQKIIEDENRSTLDKIRDVLSVLPEGYKDIDFRQLYMLRDKYPDIYQLVEMRLVSGWEGTIGLLEQGIEEGVIRPVSIPIVKLMLEASLAQFFQRDVLLENGISYQQGLEEVVGILMEGIIIK